MLEGKTYQPVTVEYSTSSGSSDFKSEALVDKGGVLFLGRETDVEFEMAPKRVCSAKVSFKKGIFSYTLYGSTKLNEEAQAKLVTAVLFQATIRASKDHKNILLLQKPYLERLCFSMLNTLLWGNESLVKVFLSTKERTNLLNSFYQNKIVEILSSFNNFQTAPTWPEVWRKLDEWGFSCLPNKKKIAHQKFYNFVVKCLIGSHWKLGILKKDQIDEFPKKVASYVITEKKRKNLRARGELKFFYAEKRSLRDLFAKVLAFGAESLRKKYKDPFAWTLPGQKSFSMHTHMLGWLLSGSISGASEKKYSAANVVFCCVYNLLEHLENSDSLNNPAGITPLIYLYADAVARGLRSKTDIQGIEYALKDVLNQVRHADKKEAEKFMFMFHAKVAEIQRDLPKA